MAGRWQRLDKGQLIKWTVYSLLIVNWGYYFVEEMYISSHVLRQGGTFLEWTEEFATTIARTSTKSSTLTVKPSRS